MRYETLKAVAILSLIIYFLGGLVTNPYSLSGTQSSPEQYPFFSWFLFAKIPNPQSSATMRLLSYGDEEYNPPLTFEQMRPIFAAVGRYSTQYFPVIRAFAYEIERGGDIGPHRTDLEKIFLKPTTYQIVRMEYDQLEYWRTGSVEKLEVLGTFTTK